MEPFEIAASLLPEELRRQLPAGAGETAEEIRLRLGCGPTVAADGTERAFSPRPVTAGELSAVLERATGASLHSFSGQMLDGFICCRGLRIGVCGTAVTHGGEMTGLKDFSSLAIRIPREKRGICARAVEEICAGGFRSTLIVSRPGGGKTTALREIIRTLSTLGYRVSVIDERNELAAGGTDGMNFELGAHSDVLTGVDKERAGMMLLRGMNPQIIAMDEISKPSDVRTVLTINGCGVMLLASAHAADREDLKKRTLYRRLLDDGVFEYIIQISGVGSARAYHVSRADE